MLTTWTLVGNVDLTALATTLGVTSVTFTDGYKITAAMTWKALSGLTQDNATAPNTLVAGTIAIGTCVETLDASGVALATGVITEGNYAICHWMYSTYDNTDDSPASYAGGTTPATEWGETRYLNEAAWGTNGSAILGNNIQTAGTRITSTTQGFETLVSVTTTFSAATAYNQVWYQPKWASTYAAGVLRRYNGGTTDAHKVRGYCVGVRNISDASTDYAPVASAAFATLTGATALAAGAIAFGVAALAI